MACGRFTNDRIHPLRRRDHSEKGDGYAFREGASRCPASGLFKERMVKTIGYLTNPGLSGRGLGTDGLDDAADYIAAKFREAG